jgi:hypothetical protein
MKKDICEICEEETDGRLFECTNCECVMCFDCIGLDDICPNCNRQGRIFEV